MRSGEKSGIPCTCWPPAAAWQWTVFCEEEQALEDNDLTREVEKEKAQQGHEDPQRTRDIEREKQKQKEKASAPREPAQPKRKR